MYAYRPTILPQRMPAHPGYKAPTGPLATTLPQRAGMATQGPVQLGGVPDRPFGMTMPQPSGGGMLQNGRPRVFPGSGMGFYRDDEYNPTPQQRAIDDAGVARDQMYGAADPAGPYSGTAGMRHFGPLASYQPNTMQPPDPSWQQGHLDAADASQRRARGLTAAYVQTGPPRTPLSPEMESRRQAAVARQADRKQMLGAGRNIRANQMYGTPLRPDLFPRAEIAYSGGGGPLASADRSVNAMVSRNTTTDADNNQSTNWGGVSRGIYDDPKFKSDPKAAWDALRKNGMTSADLAALIDDAEGGLFSLGADTDPNYIAWLDGLRGAAGMQGPAQPPGYAPVGPLGTPSVVGRGGQYAPPLPRGTPVVQPPIGSAAPPVASHGEGPVGIPDMSLPWARSAPPPTPPRRRPGPLFRPNF